MNKNRLLSIWQILILSVILLPLFLFFIPYWIRRFDVLMPFSLSCGAFTYGGVIIFCAGLFFCLYSVFFMVKRTGGIPLDRIKGGAPPVLVTDGPYKCVRNPQQLGGIVMLLGLTIYFESVSILIYTIAAIVLNHILVVFVEEKGLRKNLGTDYENYCKDVPRWIPHLWKKEMLRQ